MTLDRELFVVPSRESPKGCCRRKIGFVNFSDAFEHALMLANRRTIPCKKMWVYACKGKTGRFHIGNRWIEVPNEVYKLMRHIQKLEQEMFTLRNKLKPEATQ